MSSDSHGLQARQNTFSLGGGSPAAGDASAQVGSLSTSLQLRQACMKVSAPSLQPAATHRVINSAKPTPQTPVAARTPHGDWLFCCCLLAVTMTALRLPDAMEWSLLRLGRLGRLGRLIW